MPDPNVLPAIMPKLAELEDALGLPRGFIAGLTDADDWTAIIKTAALVEAAAIDALGRKASSDSQRAWIEKQVKNGLHRKADAAHAWGLLTERQFQVVALLAEIRNRAAHGLSGLTFSLSKWLEVETNRKRFDAVVMPVQGILNDREWLILGSIFVAVRLFEAGRRNLHLEALVKALGATGGATRSIFDPVQHEAEGH